MEFTHLTAFSTSRLLLAAFVVSACALERPVVADKAVGDTFARLAGCSKYLVDVGSGFGVAAEILLRERAPAQWTFETSSYPKAGSQGRLNMERDYRERFAHIRGISDNAGLCIVGVEGNPWFRKRLQPRETELTSRGHPAVFLAPTALADHDGEASFRVDRVNAAVNYWGSSLDMGGISKPNTGSGGRVTVPALTLSTLLRRIGIREGSEVILHMNAEGGEFQAIPRAVADGSLCRFVDHLTLDLHYKYFACRAENGVRGKRCVQPRRAARRQDGQQDETVRGAGGSGANHSDTFSPAQLERWVRAPGCRVKTLKVWGLEVVVTGVDESVDRRWGQ